MTLRRWIGPAGAFVLACVTLVTILVDRQGVVSASGGQSASQAPPSGRGGQRGGGGGNADGPLVGPGNLITGAWGADPLAVDSLGWGWMTKAYVSPSYKRPFYNKA